MPRSEFSMRSAKPKPKRIPGVHLPHPKRKITRRDLLRKAWRSAKILQYLPKLRKTPSDLERVLTAAHLTEKLAKNLTFREQQQLEADLSAIGIKAGRTSGTLPERLVAKWLLSHGVEYAGMGYEANPTKGFSFQLPLLGGRAGFGGGAVVDIFLSAAVSGTKQGVAVRVNGLYWHSQPATAARDEAQRLALVAAGYVVSDISDAEVLNRGTLDTRMKELIRI
jgi:hypothetical protein